MNARQLITRAKYWKLNLSFDWYILTLKVRGYSRLGKEQLRVFLGLRGPVDRDFEFFELDWG